jgi:hypothetical protein
MAEEKVKSSFGKWLAGILAAVIAGLVVFGVESYQTAGADALCAAVDAGGNRAWIDKDIKNVRLTIINKGGVNLHSCYFFLVAYRSRTPVGKLDFDAESYAYQRGKHYRIDGVEIDPHKARDWLIPAADLGITPGQDNRLSFSGVGKCTYYNYFGAEKTTDMVIDSGDD